jgi:hypothetical protein
MTLEANWNEINNLTVKDFLKQEECYLVVRKDKNELIGALSFGSELNYWFFTVSNNEFIRIEQFIDFVSNPQSDTVRRLFIELYMKTWFSIGFKSDELKKLPIEIQNLTLVDFIQQKMNYSL